MTSSNKSPDEIREAILHALHQIAPEVDLLNLSDEVSLREELEIDSLDFLRFMVLLHKELNVDIPEVDYPKLATLKHCVEYLDLKINPIEQ